MRPDRLCHLHLLHFACILATLQSGCGLSEYESLMASAQAKARRFDEENRVLDDPIKWPEKKESDKDYVDLFFRPPRGISLTPSPNKHGPLYVFQRSEKAGPISDIWVGASTQADLAKEVIKLCPTAVGTPVPTHPSVPLPERHDTLQFDVTIFDDAATTYVVAICKRESGAQVAIVFHLERTKGIALFSTDGSKPSELSATLQMSLESLAFDSEAANLRRAFASRAQKPRPK
jgi:hypothetical protein